MIRFEDETPENEEEKKDKTLSPFERLLETRTITIFGEINMKLAQEVTQKLLLLAADSDEPIKIFAVIFCIIRGSRFLFRRHCVPPLGIHSATMFWHKV